MHTLENFKTIQVNNEQKVMDTLEIFKTMQVKQ